MGRSVDLLVWRAIDKIVDQYPMFMYVGSDYTMYPFATQNKADYQNLMDVYMDATFFPNLRKMDFEQEGWRLEHVNVQGSAIDDHVCQISLMMPYQIHRHRSSSRESCIMK